jgi:alkylation response protein AidB-like acyl-CoA dehydrogenase
VPDAAGKVSRPDPTELRNRPVAALAGLQSARAVMQNWRGEAREANVQDSAPRLKRASAGRGEADAIDWVARARAVAPVIARAADRIERDREIPDDVITALHEAQLFRMLLPRSCGGHEAEPAVYVQAIEEIAKADGSTAWCVNQASGGTFAAAYLELEAARTIFGDARAVAASGPTLGTAVAAEGGYRVSGAWAFASGSKHATWLAAHCLVQEADGKPRLGADGEPFQRTMLFPKRHATFTDIWHVIGLKGTGSDKYAVTDLFVPADYSYTREYAPDKRETGPLYRFSNYQMFGVGFAGVALGLARATLDAFIPLAAQKTPHNTGQLLRENALVQFQTGLAEAQLQAARTYLLQMLRDMWALAIKGERFTVDQRAQLRLATTYAIVQSRDVVDTVYQAAGATAIFASNPFERRFRDMHTVSQQVQAHASNFELIGQHLLGMQPKSRFL